MKKKGIYTAEQKTGIQRPVYFGYDGVSSGAVLKGSIDDPASKIQPFKKYTGVSPVPMQAVGLTAGHGSQSNMMFTFS